MMTHRDLHAQQIATTTPHEQLTAIFQRLTEGVTDIEAATADDIHDLLTNLEDQISDLLFVIETERDDLRNALDTATTMIDLAITHHDDAERFGWTDRDIHAWQLINHAYGDLAEMLPVTA